MVFSVIFWSIIFRRFDVKVKENAELWNRYVKTMKSTEQRRSEKIRGIEKRLRVLESSMNRIRIQTKEESPTFDPKPSSDSQSDDLAVNLESMSDREYQAWVMEHANASDRQILAEHFQRENEFKASLNRTQKKAFDDEVERKYANALDRRGFSRLDKLNIIFMEFIAFALIYEMLHYRQHTLSRYTRLR